MNWFKNKIFVLIRLKFIVDKSDHNLCNNFVYDSLLNDYHTIIYHFWVSHKFNYTRRIKSKSLTIWNIFPIRLANYQNYVYRVDFYFWVLALLEIAIEICECFPKNEANWQRKLLSKSTLRITHWQILAEVPVFFLFLWFLFFLSFTLIIHHKNNILRFLCYLYIHFL